MGGYAAVFAVAATITFLTTPVVRVLAVRIGAVVAPDERRVHERPTPTLGGLAMYVAFLAAMGTAWFIPQFRDNVFRTSSEPLGVVVAATVITAVGLLDDLREVSAPAKVAGQVMAAMGLYFLGVTLYFFRVPFAGVVVLSPDAIPLVTVLWVVLMANAVNLIDGLDGLAAGIVAIAAAAFFLYGDRLFKAGLLPDDSVGPLVAAIVAGVCLGFLPHNFHPARIFMGDTGAMFLGLLMAASTMVVGGRTDQPFSGQTFFFFAPVAIPFVVLGVPIVDTAFAVLRRAVRRSGLARADKEHLHHRLMRLGHGQRRAVLILWAWTAVLSGIALVPTYSNRGNALVPVLVAALAVALYTVFHPGLRAARNGVDTAQQELPFTGPPPGPAADAPRRGG